MSPNNIVIIGAGGHAKVLISTLRDLNISISHILDSDPQKSNSLFCDIQIINTQKWLETNDPKKFHGIIAIGDNKIRQNLSQEIPINWMTIIHPSAYVADNVVLGEGSVVLAGSVVQDSSVIGKHCIINTSSSVDHDCLIDDYAHIAPGTRLAGEVKIGEGCLIGIGTSIIPNIHVGSWSTIGAGSVIVKNIPSNVKAFGNPAKVII